MMRAWVVLLSTSHRCCDLTQRASVSMRKCADWVNLKFVYSNQGQDQGNVSITLRLILSIKYLVVGYDHHLMRALYTPTAAATGHLHANRPSIFCTRFLGGTSLVAVCIIFLIVSWCIFIIEGPKWSAVLDGLPSIKMVIFYKDGYLL